MGKEPLKLLKTSDTHTLAVNSPCVQRVLDQFDELKLHFHLAKDAERNYTAEMLFQMYSAAENKLYLVFLHPLLQEVNRVNKLFELDRASPVKLIGELMTLYCSILLRVMRPVTFTSWTSILDYDIDNTDDHLPLAAVDFGVAFQLALSDAKLDRTPAADDIKLRCRDYMLQLLSQMRTRLPSNIERLQSLSELSPSVVLGRYKPGLSQLSFLPLYSGDIAQLEMHWNRVSLLPWPNSNDIDILRERSGNTAVTAGF